MFKIKTLLVSFRLSLPLFAAVGLRPNFRRCCVFASVGLRPNLRRCCVFLTNNE
jgi:hypothetical protein